MNFYILRLFTHLTDITSYPNRKDAEHFRSDAGQSTNCSCLLKQIFSKLQSKNNVFKMLAGTT